MNGNGSNNLGTSDHNPNMDFNGAPTDPSQWLNNGGAWNSEWLANGKLDSTATANNKVGWVIFDFGSTVASLENLYLWAGRYNTGIDEDMQNYNLYFSNGGGIDSIPAMPNSQSWAGGSKAAADYNFANGDWAQIGSTQTLASNAGGGASPAGVTQTVSLGGISAQYIAIEIMSAYNSDPNDRVGFAQAEFTAIPETSAALLGAFGSLLLLRRRR